MNATLAMFIERQNCFYCLKIIFSSSHTHTEQLWHQFSLKNCPMRRSKWETWKPEKSKAARGFSRKKISHRKAEMCFSTVSTLWAEPFPVCRVDPFFALSRSLSISLFRQILHWVNKCVWYFWLWAFIRHSARVLDGSKYYFVQKYNCNCVEPLGLAC